jgi:hypothetical protein
LKQAAAKRFSVGGSLAATCAALQSSALPGQNGSAAAFVLATASQAAD